MIYNFIVNFHKFCIRRFLLYVNTLNFETNGGTAIDSISQTAGTVISLDSYRLEKEGYIFDGWYSDPDFANAITEATLTHNMTVYAKWSKAADDNQGNEDGKDPETGDDGQNPADDTKPETGDNDQKPSDNKQAGNDGEKSFPALSLR